MKKLLAVVFFSGLSLVNLFISCSMLDITREFTYVINLAQLKIADTTGHGLQLLGKASNEYLSNLTSVTKELELEPAGVRRFEELYMYSPHAAKFFFSGNANTEPVDFQIKFYVIIEVTGNPI